MAHRVERTRSYDDDLFGIWLYASAYSLDHADRLSQEIESMVEMLADFPNLGESQPLMGPRRRRKLCGKYAIYYDVLDSVVVVLRVLHTARDIDRIEELRRS